MRALMSATGRARRTALRRSAKRAAVRHRVRGRYRSHGLVPAVVTYVGARGRFDMRRGLSLDPRQWAWQPKIDGCYVTVALDGIGRVDSVRSRSGATIPQAADLIGIVAGAPDSVLVGEFEAHTEAGNRAAATRGWRLVHLFDCLRYAGADMAGAPYSTRYGLLHRGQAYVESSGSARDRTFALDERGAAHDAVGRYCAGIPRDLRRFPIVPASRGHGAGDRLWAEFVARLGGEGLVAVRLDAPAARRGAKVKIKATDDLDCRVVAADRGRLRCEYGGHLFTVAGRAPIGSVVAVACDGFYESVMTPRFPRVRRVRIDLSPAILA